MEEGIHIDFSNEQPEKADSPRIETLQPGSNVTAERFLHAEKQSSEMIVTDEGTQIDVSE
jgi:hypothetical protein